MIKEILVLNRMEAELLCYGIGHTPQNKWLLISICNPKYEMIRSDVVKKQICKWGCVDYISLTFDDITKDNYHKIKMYGGKGKLFSKKDAKAIVNFLEKYKNNTEELTLITHCHAGISRSGAVGWFGCKFLGLNKIDFLTQNKNLYPNKYILQMLESMAGIDVTQKDEYEKNFFIETID